MNATATAYEQAHRPLTALLDSVAADAWTNPSPCEGWAARDVVRHLVDTQREFLTGRGVDLGEALDADGDPAAAWRHHAGRVLAVISDDVVPAATYDGYFGATTIGATLEQFYIWDMLVHRWDVAVSVDADAGLSEKELDRIEAGADSFGEALYMEGVCRPGVEEPAAAGRQARVLARLGRSAPVPRE